MGEGEQGGRPDDFRASVVRAIGPLRDALDVLWTKSDALDLTVDVANAFEGIVNVTNRLLSENSDLSESDFVQMAKNTGNFAIHLVNLLGKDFPHAAWPEIDKLKLAAETLLKIVGTLRLKLKALPPRPAPSYGSRNFNDNPNDEFHPAPPAAEGSGEPKGLGSLENRVQALASLLGRLEGSVKATVDGIGIRADERLKALENSFDEIKASATDVADKATAEIKDARENILKLTGIVSGEATSLDFFKSADAEATSANRYRGFAVVLMLASALVLALTYFESGAEAFSWHSIAVRLLLSVALSVPAVYLARQSGEHRRQQYSYRQISLELSALPTFIATLPADEKAKILMAFAERSFGAKKFGEFGGDGVPVISDKLLELAKELLAAKPGK